MKYFVCLLFIAILETQSFSTEYDEQIILNLGSGKSAIGLTEKRSAKKGKSSDTIDLREQRSESDFLAMKKLTSQSRLYLVGHGAPNGNTLSSDSLPSNNNSRVAWSYTQFADLIAQHAPQLKGQSEAITISLVACHGGVGGLDSFGAKLSKDLDRRGIHAKIHARMGSVSRHDGKSPYKKTVDGEYHKDGSKVVIETVNGNTTVEPHLYSENKSSAVCLPVASPPGAAAVSSAASGVTAVVQAINRTEAYLVNSKDEAVTRVNEVPPDSIIYWPSSRGAGKFGFLRKKADGSNTSLADALLYSEDQLNQELQAVQKFSVRSKEDALSRIEKMAPESVVYWPSSRGGGKFGFIKKKPVSQPTTLNDALLLTQEELAEKLLQ